MLIAISIPIFIYWSPALAWGKLIGKEAFFYNLPYFTFYKNAIASQDSLLWNPLNFAGFPNFVGVQSILAPLNYIALIFLDPFPAYYWLAFLMVALSGFLTARLLTEFGASFWASITGGITYTFAQLPLSDGIYNISAVLFLPLLFWLILRLKNSHNRWRWIIAGIVAVAWAWLSTTSQFLIYALMAGGAFSIFMGWQESKKRFYFLPLLFGITVLAGTALASLYIWPLATFTGLSPRNAGLSYTVAADHSFLPTDFIRLLIPSFKPPLGIPFGHSGTTAGYYFGILPLFFIVAAIIKSRTSQGKFFIWLFLGTLATAMVYSPIFWLMTKLPVLKYFRGPGRWLFVGALAGSILAGFGFDRFLEPNGEKWKKSLISIFILATAVMTVAVVGSNLALTFWSHHIFDRITSLYPASYKNIITKFFAEFFNAVNIFDLKVFLPLFFLSFSMLTITFGLQKRWLLAAIAAVNFLTIFWSLHPTVPKTVVTQTPSTINFLQEHPGRTTTFLTDEYYQEKIGSSEISKTDEYAFHLASASPNTNLFYGVETIEFFEQIMSRDMWRLLALIGGRVPTFAPPFAENINSKEEKIKLLESRKSLLDFIGVRYIISGYPLDTTIFPQVLKVNVGSDNIPIGIYENKEARPLLSFAERIDGLEKDRETVFEKWKAKDFSGIFVECNICPTETLFSTKGSIEIIEKKNTEITARISVEEKQLVIFSQNDLPEWKIFVNGNKIEHYTVNTVFPGFLIPPGIHEVTIRYQYPFLRL